MGQASSLHLSMHLATDFVEAALAEAAGGEFHWTGIFPIESNQMSGKDALHFVTERNWSDKVFRKCSVSFDTSEICLVPRAFFEPDKAMELLSFQCNLTSSASDHIEFPEWDAVLIFGLPDWTFDLCKKYPNARFYPISALAARHAQSFAGAGQDVMGIFVSSDHLVLTIFRNKKLHLLNTFHIAGDEDVLYHASNAALRLGIDFENAVVQLATTKRSESLANIFKHYNRHTTHLFLNESSDHMSYLSMLHTLCA
jgi:hypothetical protein